MTYSFVKRVCPYCDKTWWHGCSVAAVNCHIGKKHPDKPHVNQKYEPMGAM